MNMFEKICLAHDLDIDSDILNVYPDQVLTHDGTATSVFLQLEAMGVQRLKPFTVVHVDHNTLQVGHRNPDDHVYLKGMAAKLGAIYSLPEKSVQPNLVITEIIKNPLGLGMILAGALLNISFLIWVLRVIPSRESISLGFRPDGLPRESLDSVRLILFPILNSSAYLADLVLGLFMFRNPEFQALAYILWGAGILTALLFHIGLGFNL